MQRLKNKAAIVTGAAGGMGKSEALLLSPQGRVAEAHEISWGALYLASDESSFITGIDLTIDGGAAAK